MQQHKKFDHQHHDAENEAKPEVQQHKKYDHQHHDVENDCSDDDDSLHSFLPEHRDLLENYQADLCIKMDPLKVITQLRKQGVFALYDYEKIVTLTTTQERNGHILDYLYQKGPKAFDEFIFCLKSINTTHAQLACEIQPVRYHILWFVSSPTLAASVVFTLQRNGKAKFRDITERPFDSDYLVRRGTVFQRKITPKQDDAEVLIDNRQDITFANEVEVCLVFPNSNKGDIVKSVMREAFEKVCPEANLVVMSGVCASDGKVKKGDLIFVDQGDTVPGDDSDFGQIAKDAIRSLVGKQPKWMKKALSNGFRTPLFGIVNVPSSLLESQHPKLDCNEDPPSCLSRDTDTCEFYSLCKSGAFRSKPHFVCKGVLNNSETALVNSDGVHVGTPSTDWSSCVLMEVCRVFVERFRTSAAVI